MYVDRVLPGTRPDGRGRVWRIGSALVLTLALAAFYAGAAQAEPRIKVGGCEIYATNRVDPIAFSEHLHHQFGNKSTTNSSTGTSLFNNTSTSCS